MRNKSIKTNALLNGFRTVLNLIFPLITFPYISRILSVDDIGKYNFSNSIVTYFLLIAALGIDKYAIREGTKYRDNRKEFSKFASEVFTLNLISTLVSYLLLFLYIVCSDKASSYKSCIIIFSLQIFFTSIGAEWIYSIFEEYTYITIRSIIFKIISIFLLFLCVQKEGDYLAYTWITVFASVGSNVLNYVNVKRFCDIKIKFHNLNMKLMLVPVMIIFASNVAIQIYVNADITMLGYMKDDYIVGIYSVSTKIYAIVKSIFAAILTVTIPRFSLYAGKQMKREYQILFNNVFSILVIIVFPAMFGLMILGRNIILIIAGSKYIAANTSLSILSFALIFALLSSFLNQCVLLPYKREKVFLKSSLISAIINVGLNFLFIPAFGEVGAAITTFISEVSMTVINYIGCKNLISEYIWKKELFKNIISVSTGTIVVIVICYFSVHLINNLVVQTLVAVLGSIIGYGLLLILFRNKFVFAFIGAITSKMKNGN